MIFPYWAVRRGGQRRHLPLIPLTVYGPKTHLEVLALVDSGAEHNVFGQEVADRVGLSLEKGSPVLLAGIEGKDLPGHLVSVELQVGRQRWHAPTIFSQALGSQVILGQAGFFAFFTVTFRYQKSEMRIQRAQ